MAGSRKWQEYTPGDPLEMVIPPVLEVPPRSVLYQRKISLYALGLKANARRPANVSPQAAGEAFMATAPYAAITKMARRFAGYRDDGSGMYLYLPNGYRERVQANFNELLDAFWSGWYGWGMLDRGQRTGVTGETYT